MNRPNEVSIGVFIGVVAGAAIWVGLAWTIARFGSWLGAW